MFVKWRGCFATQAGLDAQVEPELGRESLGSTCILYAYLSYPGEPEEPQPVAVPPAYYLGIGANMSLTRIPFLRFRLKHPKRRVSNLSAGSPSELSPVL